MNDLLKNILSDIRVELLDEFDKNFVRKAFFDQPWEHRRHNTGRGTLLVTSGRLRRSLRATVKGTGVSFGSDTPYAGLHNSGGKVKVTPAMRKYFWAMYYKNTAGVYMSIQTRQATTKGNVRKSSNAEYWRSLALKKGGIITIPRRQFMGDHAEVEKTVKETIGRNLEEYAKRILVTALKQK